MVGRLNFGYRQVTTLRTSILFDEGRQLRGHEFHYSDWIDRPRDISDAYLINPRAGGEASREGFVHDNLLASYVHLHFGQDPGLAERFVGNCRQWKNQRISES